MTSVTNIAELPRPRRRGQPRGALGSAPRARARARSPRPGVGTGRRYPGRSVRCHSLLSRPRLRIVSIGGSRPVQIRKRGGSLVDQDLEPVDDACAALPCDARRAPSRAARRPGPPRFVVALSASASNGSAFRSPGRRWARACLRRGPRVVALTSRSKSARSGPSLALDARRAGAELGRRGPRPSSAVRFQIETSAPASRSAQTTARAEPPAPSTSARMPSTGGAGARR